MADRMFGVFRRMLLRTNVFSNDDIGLLCEQIENVFGQKLSRAYVYTAASRLAWDDTLKEKYKIPFPKAMHDLASNHHIFGAGTVTPKMVSEAKNRVTEALKNVNALEHKDILLQNLNYQLSKTNILQNFRNP